MTCKYMKEYRTTGEIKFKAYKCIYPTPRLVTSHINPSFPSDSLYWIKETDKCRLRYCNCYEEDYDDPFTPSCSMSISKSPSPTTSSKSPIGIKPRKLANEERFKKIRETMARYLDKNLPIPIEWVEEYNEYGRVSDGF